MVEAATKRPNDDSVTVSICANGLAGLSAQLKNEELNFRSPSTSRDKAPYEALSRQTRFCSI